jgi:hypothetical protein
MVATLALAATPVAADGLAADDAYSVAEDAPGGLSVTADLGLLANDTGGSVVLCVVSIDTTGLHGALDLGGASDGSFTYTPPPNFNGTTSFTYVVGTKAAEACPAPPVNAGTATVTITVTPVNDPPIATGDSFTVLKDRTLNVGPPGLLANDTDVDGDQLTAVAGSAPSHGTVTIAANGSFSYTPNTGYRGPDVFSYRASDGTDQSLLRAVSLTVTPLPATPSPAPLPTPTLAPPTPSAEPSPSASPLPSDSGLASASPAATGPASASPSAGPVTAPAGGETSGGPPLLAIVALILLAGLLGVAGYYFMRSQRAGGDDELEPEHAATSEDFDDDRGEA